MKYLILMRHAKAEKDAPSGEDFDRRLTTRGHEEARSVAAAMKEYGITPDFALVSAAARTRETFAEVEGVFGGIRAITSKDFYNAGADALRRFIDNNETEGQCMLVVAHNPGVQLLVSDYLFEGAASMSVIEKVRTGYATATATVFEIDVAGRPVYDGIYVAKGAQ